jgi:hypothetical protein
MQRMNKILSAVLMAAPCIVACAPRQPNGAGGSGGRGGTSGTGGMGGHGGNNLPCNIEAILKTKCQLCHGVVPAGAPMSLVTHADTQAVRGGEPTWKHMQAHIHGETPPMPPPGYPQLTTDELAALDAWFAAEAPAGHELCAGGPDAGSARIGPDFLPCKPNQFFTASNGSGGKYAVPKGTKDKYVDFYFPNPFAAGEQAIAWAPVIDNQRVIHHYILFGGAGQLVVGWGPGDPNHVMDEDLGLVVDPAHYARFQLQVHYNNPDGPDVMDGSGVALCTTKTPRPNPAGIISTGVMNLVIPPNQVTSLTGTCSNPVKAGKTLRLINGSPHMHKTGYGFKSELFDATGRLKTTISNVPDGTWNFDHQSPFPHPERPEIVPGDTIKVTCKYLWKPQPGDTRPFVGWGFGTSDEMCFDFSTVYPVDDANRTCLF